MAVCGAPPIKAATVDDNYGRAAVAVWVLESNSARLNLTVHCLPEKPVRGPSPVTTNRPVRDPSTGYLWRGLLPFPPRRPRGTASPPARVNVRALRPTLDQGCGGQAAARPSEKR